MLNEFGYRPLVAFLTGAGSGYGIGLDEDGHRVEFLGGWRELADLRLALDGPEPVYLEIEDWQVLAVDDELRLPLPRKAMAERARFIRSALGRQAQLGAAAPAGRVARGTL